VRLKVEILSKSKTKLVMPMIFLFAIGVLCDTNR
jgi:hypothetical protein